MRFVCAILAVWILLGLKVRAELVDGIQVVVDRSIITYQDVVDHATLAADELRRRYRNEPAVGQQKLDALRQETVERLVDDQLILRDFESAGYNLPESIIDERLQAYIRSIYGDDRIKFIKTLQAEGRNYEQFRKDFRDRFILEQMRLAHNEKAEIISPHKIEVYYVQHTNDFKVEDQVKLRMIVLSKPADDAGQTRKLAEEILTKIKEGAKFADMAAVYSQGAERSNGGERDWEKTSALKKELAETAANLEPGQMSGVIETPEACYLMQVIDKRPAHVQPLKKVRDEIEQTLLAQDRQQSQQRWIDRLKKKTFIKYF
jgi:peptidyl-prolyl cis-trans isomerase SurA